MKNKTYNDINGYVVLDKPKDYTSNDCLAVLKKYIQPNKIGHIGTLDVNATGVLCCLLGTATKCQDYLMKQGTKVYDAELVLGISTDTEDFTGEIIEKKNCDSFNVDSTFKNTVDSFVGDYSQVPPMYSSKKVSGKKLIDLARIGKIVDRKPCNVKIYNIEIKETRKDEIKGNIVFIIRLLVECSKGTYIRTLCKDIGLKLDIPACMGNLRRIKSGDFNIIDSIKIDDIKEKASRQDFSFVKPCLYKERSSALTFGKFETLHLGHQLIVKKIVDYAKENDLESTVLIIGKNMDNCVISSAQKISKFKLMGVDNILEFPFIESTKKMSASDFVNEILIKQLKAEHIVVGSDCSFGKDATGDSSFLKELCKKHNISVEIIDKMKIENSDKDISSTYIFEEYKNGNKELVSKLIDKVVN